MTTTTATETWEFDLSLQKPISLNDRMHWRERNQLTQQVREEAMMMAKVTRIPRGQMRKVRVTLTFRPPDERRRDADNLVATLKAVCDGLVDAEVVADDTPAEMEKEMPVIGDVLRATKGMPPPRRFVVKVEQLM